jgi:hypothetical protein
VPEDTEPNTTRELALEQQMVDTLGMELAQEESSTRQCLPRASFLPAHRKPRRMCSMSCSIEITGKQMIDHGGRKHDLPFSGKQARFLERKLSRELVQQRLDVGLGGLG